MSRLVSGFALLLLVTPFLLVPAAHGAEARLLTLEDVEQMGGTDFDGGAGDYLLRNDRIEAVLLAIGATPDFDIDFTPGNLPSRGVLIDVGTRGDRNDQFDELHQALNMEYTEFIGPNTGFDQNLVEYFGPDKGFPEPVFQNDGATASITVFGLASLNFDGEVYSSTTSPTLGVRTTYSVTDGEPFIEIETVVTNFSSDAVPAFTISDLDAMVAKGRLPFQPFPGLGPLPRTELTKLAVPWDFLVLPGTNSPADGPANNDGSPVGEVCYGYMSVDPAGPMVGWGINVAGAPSRFFDLDTLASQDVPTLASGDSLTYRRRLVVAAENTVDACLRLMAEDLYPHGSALFGGRVIDSQGRPIPKAHLFFDNTTPGSPSYPESLAVAEGSALPMTHTVTDADGRFEVALPALADPAVTPSVYTATVKAEERDTLDIGPFTVDPAALAAGSMAVGDFVVSGTGTLDFTVQRRLLGGQRIATPVKLSIYGSGDTANPDFGSQYLSLRDFPGLDPLSGGDNSYLGETFASLPALNFVMDADGEGSIDLAPGTYTVYASRGLDFTIDAAEITVAEGQSTSLDLEIRNVVAGFGVASLDAHIHGVKSYDASQPLSSRVLSYVTAGVEIMVGTDHDYVTDYAPIIEALNLRHEIRSITGLELTGRFAVPPGPGTAGIDAWPVGIGHWGAWPVEVIPGARRNGAVQDEYLTPATAIDRLRGVGALPLIGAEPSTATLEEWLVAIQAGQPGTPGEGLPTRDEIVVLNHPRGTALGMFEALASPLGYQPDEPVTEFPNNLIALPSLYNKSNVGSAGTDTDGFSFDAMELLNGDEFDKYLEVRDDWFSLLDQGIHKTGVANSDSHRAVLENPGIGRTYVFHSLQSSLTLDTQEIIDGLRSMRAIGSSGPMVRFGVLGDVGVSPGRYFNTIGETVVVTGETVGLRIRVDAPPWIPVQEVRIFQNGCLVETLPIRPDKVLGGPTLRFLRRVDLEGVDGDAYLTIEAGLRHDDDGNALSPELLETMQLILPLVDMPFAFTNPVFVDRDGDGYRPPGLAPCP